MLEQGKNENISNIFFFFPTKWLFYSLFSKQKLERYE